ncbi:MAG: metal-dependent hydrolase [Caldisericaceae bacterium]
MVFLTHLGFGMLIGSYSHSFSGVLLSAVGSVVPDIDIPFSKVSKLTFNHKGAKLKHRGITHSVFTPLIIYFIYYYLFKNQAILPFILGYFSHIILDMFNPKGVSLFSPFIKHSFSFPITLRTGSKQDYLIGLCFWLADLFLFIKSF